VKQLLDWLDHRTGYRYLVSESLYERIPGGSRWRYVWGSTLVFAFMVQVVTGLILWMGYSPSTQTAWESVYYLDHHMTLGWLLRSVHHYAAQVMVVLLVVHLLQVVIDKAYKAPREINFWVGLILMQIVLGSALTGYLLPWDQKGYWATKVATEIAGSVGDAVPALAVGGQEYGHHTLTRFFALHAGILPASLVLFLVIHIAVFRRHSITAHIDPHKPRPDQYFWPDQVLKDAVACLLVLGVIIGLSVFRPAELMAPADPAENYSAARPEWYFLFLFQFLKFFPGEYGKLLGAIVIPAAVMLLFFLMPFTGRSRVGHWFNVLVLVVVLAGAGVLTGLALQEDYYARLVDESEFAELREAQDVIAAAVRKRGSESVYFGLTPEEQLRTHFGSDPAKTQVMIELYGRYRKYQKSEDFLEAVAEAERNAERVVALAAAQDPQTGELVPQIPPTGALTLLRHDPKTQGPKLFRRYCASCHDHADEDGSGISSIRPLQYEEVKGKRRLVPNGAPNLYRFAGREWLRGFLDPELIAKAEMDERLWRYGDAPYFGNTAHRDGEMVEFVTDTFSDLDEEDREAMLEMVAWLSAEAQLPSQAEKDAELQRQALADVAEDADEETRRAAIHAARDEALDNFGCFDCHKFHDQGDLGDSPDLTGYGSRQWLIDLISDPNHERFYGASGNDRMPAFNPPDDANKQQLTPEKIGMIVDWLRGDWH